MRFVFVDRIVAVVPGRSIETLRNVSATEDVFADHFPGCPILPGALIVESFGQAVELLIGMSHDWKTVGRLARLSRVSFHHVVRPGDQLRLRAELRGSANTWVLAATADVDGRRVATGTLEYVLEEARAGSDAAARAARLGALAQELRRSPLELAAKEITR
jgi:3-hydroxyacyl-[acyl-carrier-protein] dehydratase